MIAWLSGRLRHKAADHLIIDVAGVGYRVFIPLSTYCNILMAEGMSASISIPCAEDALSLRFFDPGREGHVLLLTVFRYRSQTCALVLSSLSVQDLQTHSVPRMTRGSARSPNRKETAGRMVLELKDKIQSIMPAIATSRQGGCIKRQ